MAAEHSGSSSFLADLSEAQRLGRSVCDAVFATLKVGDSREDIAGRLVAEAERVGAPLLIPPCVELGYETAGGVVPRLLHGGHLRGGELIALGVRPTVGRAAGDLCQTRVFGENGRLGHFQKLARQVFDQILADLPSCRTERDITTLAGECARRRGFELYHPVSGSIAHPILPLRGSWRDRIGPQEDLLVARIKKIVPGMSRPFDGPWAIEPRLLVQDQGYSFHEVALLGEEGELIVLGA